MNPKLNNFFAELKGPMLDRRNSGNKRWGGRMDRDGGGVRGVAPKKLLAASIRRPTIYFVALEEIASALLELPVTSVLSEPLARRVRTTLAVRWCT